MALNLSASISPSSSSPNFIIPKHKDFFKLRTYCKAKSEGAAESGATEQELPSPFSGMCFSGAAPPPAFPRRGGLEQYPSNGKRRSRGSASTPGSMVVPPLLKMEKQHIVLVHGTCHGAWCWYKVKPLLEASGHRVTALDMAASGIHPAKIQEVNTLAEYTQPLSDFLASLPPQERVILVGHSFGGLNLAFAMETFPKKIVVAVFLTAFMPDTVHSPSFVLDQVNERIPKEAFLDTEFTPYSSSLQNQLTIFFGPKFLSSMLYQLSPIENIELAKFLTRLSSLFTHDLSTAKKFTSEKYGSVKRVFITCEDDKTITMDFQKWMIQNYNVDQVFNIKDSDHMPMFSKPEELVHCLSKIAIDYA